MRKILTDFCRAAAEVVMLSLILCVLAVIFLPAPLCYLWVLTLPAYSLAGVLIRAALHRWPLLQYALCLAAAAGGTLLTLRAFGTPQPGDVVFMLVLAAVLCIRGRIMASRVWDEIAPVYFYAMIMAFNLIFTLLCGVIPVLEPFRPVATALGPFIVVVGLLTMNSLHLFSLTAVEHKEALAGSLTTSRVMGRQNRILLLVIFGVVLLVSGVGWILTAVKWLAAQLFTVILAILRFLTPASGGSGGGGGGGSLTDMFGEVPEKASNPFWEAVEQVLIYGVAILGTAALAILLLYALYRGVRALIRLLRELAAHFASLHAEAEEYTDTREALIDLKDLPRHYLNQAKEWLENAFWREPPWNAFKTVPEQVRHLYRRAVYGAMSRGFRYKSSRTPGETLAAAAPHSRADADTLETLRIYYERVRYGTEEPEADKVEELNKKI